MVVGRGTIWMVTGRMAGEKTTEEGLVTVMGEISG